MTKQPDSSVVSPSQSAAVTQKKKPFSLKPFSALLIAFMIFIIPQLLAGIGFAIYTVASGGDIESLAENTSTGLTFTIFAAAEIMTLIGFYILLKVTKTKAVDYGWTLKGMNKIWAVIPAFFVYFFATVIVQAVASFFVSEEVLNAEQELGFEDATAAWELVLAFVALVILAPVIEELLFRGYLFNELRKEWSFLASMLVTAVLFGVAHLQLNVGLDTFVLAVPLAFLMEYTRTLAAPIALHAAKNAVAYVFLFVVDPSFFESATLLF